MYQEDPVSILANFSHFSWHNIGTFRLSWRSEGNHSRLMIFFIFAAVWLQSCQPTYLPEKTVELPGSPTSLKSGISTNEPVVTPESAPLADTSSPAQSNTVLDKSALPALKSTDLPELKKELFAALGGGGGGCEYAVSQVERPEVLIVPNVLRMHQQDISLCIINFPLNAEVTVEILDPSNQTVEQKVYRVGNQPQKGVFIDPLEFSMIEIPVSFPLSLPTGAWRVRATSNGEVAENTFLLGEYDPSTTLFLPGEPIVTFSPILPLADITPMNPRLRAPYRAGDTIRVQGVQFDPNIQLRAGLYQKIENNLSLINSFEVITDKKGSFTYDLHLDNDLPSGEYFIVPAGEDRSGEDRYGRFYVQNEPTRTVIWGDFEENTSLVVGEETYLADQEAYNQSLSDLAIGLQIGKLQSGERVILLEGPLCSDEYVLWYVQSLDTNLLGWMTEGVDRETWILPLP